MMVVLITFTDGSPVARTFRAAYTPSAIHDLKTLIHETRIELVRALSRVRRDACYEIRVSLARAAQKARRAAGLYVSDFKDPRGLDRGPWHCWGECAGNLPNWQDDIDSNGWYSNARRFLEEAA